MTFMMTLAIAGLISAAIPAAMFWQNRRLFVPPVVVGQDVREPGGAGACRSPKVGPATAPPTQVSLLIPARDEAGGIAEAVQTALASEGVWLEVVVLDDHSSDATAQIVRLLAADHPAVRLIAGEPLPQGWNGKQYACYRLAAAARYDRLVFIDADVRLSSDALRRLVAYQDRHHAALLSAFPHQVTGTWLEKWLIPMMHFILLGFLPIARMRQSRQKAYAAGCGQLFITRRSDYQTAGTHSVIKHSRHDGIKLPAAYRAAGLSTDVVDGTPIACCRMYRSAPEVVRGLLKNATEGIAAPRLIVPFTMILLGGSLLPWVAVVLASARGQWAAAAVATAALAVGHLPRALAATQFRQSWQGVVFHTPAVTLFIAIQWLALFNHLLGRQVSWRGRA